MNLSEVDETMKPGWNNKLGVVDTIFEDDDEDELDSLSSSPLSFPLFSPSSPLQSGIDAWTAVTGRQPDVKIHVRGICFNLHKDPLISKSSYLKRQLIRVSEYTLSPPLKVAADTFKLVADFCYSNHAAITSSNVAALRIAAELLEMDVEDGVEDSLREITESYLCNVLLDNKESTYTIFRASLNLLPEAEQTARITSRCLEMLFCTVDDGDCDSGGAFSCADGLKTVSPENFEVIADSMQRRFTRSHDLLYRVIDLYFLVYNGKVMSEDQRTQITRCIDCSILSEPLLMHAVQNPRMPLRFVVQAMLIEQLNTHRSIFSAINTTTTTAITKPRPHHEFPSESPATLGAILERDAALRQVAHLRSAIDTTTSRIQTLEKELSFMKKILGDRQKEKREETGILLLEDGGKSASCRFSLNDGNNHKVERGERGSVSSSMVRLFGGGKTNSNTTDIPKHRLVGSSSSSSWCMQSDHRSPKANAKGNFRQRLIKGLRNVFGVNNKLKKDGNLSEHNKGVGHDQEEITFESFARSNSLPHDRSSFG
ncbi:BTB/POZ domain-containing protein At3g49900 [Silene latifolia]|uniref:BTB/POZ domain-containing protein At3g49900 n=1 Tax=Silene latifolia TaxID=37657 RepID=UPI003D78346A